MKEDAKISFLFKQVMNSDLKKSNEKLKAHMATNPSGIVSYTTADDNLIISTSDLPNMYP